MGIERRKDKGERRSVIVREYDGAKRGSAYWMCLVLLHFVIAIPLGAQNHAGPSDAFRGKALDEIAKDNRRNFQFVGAKLRTGYNVELAWRQLDSLLAEPTGDMFWTYPATAFYFYCNDLLSDEWKEKFRRTWKTYTNYRGDTENHFLMYYGTLYLMSQEWPGLPGSEWFNGKSSEENFREAEEYLNFWIDETVRYGQTEWDSPRYFYYYILPLLTLRDFARDPRMKMRCEMMLEYLLVDYAAEYLNGNYCGAHSRDGDGSVINPRNAEARSYSDFYWEDSLSFILPDLAFAAMSSFRCPAIIRDIAHDRDTAFVHYEQKRSRAKMRYSDEKFTRVYKTTYMTPEYALGSIQGGIQQPIQQHTWDITFAVDRSNNTLFSLHPYASGEELGTFFPEEPELMVKAIAGSKASYGNPDKWIGGSPYESISQTGGSLTVRYAIPHRPRSAFAETSFSSEVVPTLSQNNFYREHIDLYCPRSLDLLIKDSASWTAAFMEDVIVSIDIEGADSSVWSDEKDAYRLRLYGDTITLSVITAKRSEMDQRFPAAWLDEKKRQDSTSYPARQFPDLLFNGPHLRSEYDTGILTMTCHGRTRTLDFNRSEILER